MENYLIIKNYLETLPVNMTIEEAVNNIKKAEVMKQDSLNKIQEKMNENIGKCYFYEDFDDGIMFTRFFTKITGTKIINGRVLYVATIIEVSDETIYYLDDTTFCDGDLKDDDIVDESIFNSAYDMYHALANFKK